MEEELEGGEEPGGHGGASRGFISLGELYSSDPLARTTEMQWLGH
jgi:hypothetical protein